MDEQKNEEQDLEVIVPLGKILAVFGPISQPLYTIRLIRFDSIINTNIKKADDGDDANNNKKDNNTDHDQKKETKQKDGKDQKDQKDQSQWRGQKPAGRRVGAGAHHGDRLSGCRPPPSVGDGRPRHAAMNSFHLRTMYWFSSMTAFQQATAPMRSR